MVSTREVGYATGQIASWAALVTGEHETNPELMWPRSIEVFDRMRREDSQVKSVLKAVTLPIRGTHWEIDPTGCRDEVAQQIADDLGLPIKGQQPKPPLRRAGRFSWQDHLRMAMLELVFGNAFFEQVYYIDDRGRARLRKLGWRPPRTISDIKVARDGGLVSITQHGYGVGDKPRPIPVERLVAYVNEREGGNWVGESLLRAAYKNWLLKDRLLRSQALTVDRNGLGVPVYEAAPVPEGADIAQAEQWTKTERENGLKIATSFRSGEQAGAAIPHGGKLTLTGVTGDLPDADKPIRYHDEQIARGMLAHFLNLGTETGSWALGTTFADFFVSSLQAHAKHIADVTQQHVIDDLVDLNWGTSEPAPQLVFEEIGSKSPLTAEAIKQLVDCGAVWMDASTEEHIRAQFGLPMKEEGRDARDRMDA